MIAEQHNPASSGTPPPPAEDPSLSLESYLTALLREHTSLRDEINSTISSRNAGFLALAAAVIGALAKIFSIKRTDIASTSGHIVVLGLLPLLWFAIATLQAVAMGKTDRAGLAAQLTEKKIETLFVCCPGPKLARALSSIRQLHYQVGLKGVSGGGLSGLNAPIVWEQLVRSKRRFFDRPAVRSGLVFTAAALASIGGPILVRLAHSPKHAAISWFPAIVIAAGGYAIVAAVLTAIVTTQYNSDSLEAIRGWESVTCTRKCLPPPDASPNRQPASST